MGGKKKETKEKPLDKMTSKELRELGLSIPEIVGVHGMNKPELISAIKKARGIEDTVGQKDASVREIKQKARAVKALYENALREENEKMAAIYRARMLRLKKKTRRA